MNDEATPKNVTNKRIRGRPFKKGEGGRPKGARNRTTLAVETLMQGEADALTRKAVDMALAGDVAALRICLDRISPVSKYSRIEIDLPDVTDAAGVAQAQQAIVQAVTTGNLRLDEALAVGTLLEGRRRTLETADLEQRISALGKLKGALP